MSGRVVEVRIAREDAGVRVDRYLKGVMGLSQKQISRLKFRIDGILVNGRQQRVTYELREGDCLQIRTEGGSMVKLLGETAWGGQPGAKGVILHPLQVLYEDADLLLVCKPSGLVCHPSHGHYGDTLANQVAAYMAERGENWSVRMVGRLDRDTSGIVVLAKNAEAAALLARQRERGRMKKTYLALAEGHFASNQGVIDLPLAREEGSLMRMGPDPAGKPAFTAYRVLREMEDCSLLQVWLLHGWGRTHQIRVHLASQGHPLVGDPLYGGQENVIRTDLPGENAEQPREDSSSGNVEWLREDEAAGNPVVRLREDGAAGDSVVGRRGERGCLGLHAWRVELDQPFTGARLEVEAPLPKWWEEREE